MTTAGDERHRNAVTFAPSPDLRSNLHHRTRKLVARHMRQADAGIVTHPSMPVAAAQARGLHTHHDPVGARLWGR